MITRLNKHVSYIILLNCCSFGFRENSELQCGDYVALRSRRFVSEADNTTEGIKYFISIFKIFIHYPLTLYLNMDRKSSWTSDEINVCLKPSCSGSWPFQCDVVVKVEVG